MDYKLTDEQCEIVVQNASRLLYEYCQKYNIHYVITGISGGLDSAVTIALAMKARRLAAKHDYNLVPIGLIMPCESDSQAEYLAKKVAKKFYVQTLKVDLTGTFKFLFTNQFKMLNARVYDLIGEMGKPGDYCDDFEQAKKIAQGNIKARLRMITVYHVARLLNGLVLSTDNLSELWMGFWTICGDVGDYGMIQNMLKGSELYDLARYLEVPEEIIAAKPDDGLGVANGDEDQLGASYPVIDEIMLRQIQKGLDPDGEVKPQKEYLVNTPPIQGVDPKTITSITRRALSNSFKRKGTINLTREELGLTPLKEIDLK